MDVRVNPGHNSVITIAVEPATEGTLEADLEFVRNHIRVAIAKWTEQQTSKKSAMQSDGASRHNRLSDAIAKFN